MRFKEYQKLMSVPHDDLSTKDKAKRKKEFIRRVEVCKLFLTGIKKGYVSDEVANQMEVDDPMTDIVTVIQAQVNEVPGEA
jgi:thiamine biosynthesis lipoprotein ApbE